MLPAVPEPVAQLAERRHDPAVVDTLRSTAAAVLSYLAALWLTHSRLPLLAPLTTLVVVQVTLYATLTRGIRRVEAVVAGVLMAIGFSELVGLSWWSLGVLILASLTVGYLVRVNEFVNEVAVSAMLVLSVSRVTATALDRVVETVIGAAVGLLFNVLFVPPVWTQTAGEAIEDLAGRVRRLLWAMGKELGSRGSGTGIASRLSEARQLDHDMVDVDASLEQAEESLKLNPRVKEGLLSRVVLRTGLDTLEICVVVIRVMARTLTDLAAGRPGEPLLPQTEAELMRRLYAHLAAAVHAYALLVTSESADGSDEAEQRLVDALETAGGLRRDLGERLLRAVPEEPERWQLHGALLTQVDRILADLDVEKRALRLAEELDRCSRERSEQHRWLTDLARYLPFRRRPRRRPRRPPGQERA